MGTEIDGVNGIIKNTTSDGDITIKGNDGGSEISALVFDMSAEGAATFNSSVTADALNISQGTPLITLTDTSSSATTTITLDGVNTTIDSNGSDGDIIFKGNDGGSEITALTLDMSDAGTANFNNKVGIVNAHDLGTGLHIKTADSGAGVNANADELVIEGSGNAGMSILAGASSKANIFLGDSGSSAIGNISYDHSDNSLSIGVNGAENFKILSTGAATITTADNTDTLSLISTDTDSAIGPNLNLYRNAGNGADADNLATVAFAGNDDAGNATDFARITAQIDDASNGSEDVYVHHRTMVAGTERLRMSVVAAETVFNEEGIDLDFRVESDALTHAFFIDAGTDHISIGNSSTSLYTLDVKQNADFTGSSSDTANEAPLRVWSTHSNGRGAIAIGGNNNNGMFNKGANDLAIQGYNQIIFDVSTTNDDKFGTKTERFRISSAGKLATGAETDPDVGAGGLTLNQGTADDQILSFKNSDIAHGMTGVKETDTYGTWEQQNGTNGGLRTIGLTADKIAQGIFGYYTNSDEAESTGAEGAVAVEAHKKSGSGTTGPGGDDNLFIVRALANTQFIVKGDGELFSNQSATVGTFDAYEDAQLVRAVDLNHMQGVINSKFDKFVQYNKDDLQKAKLIGTDADGNATPFVNITGMSRLHNGAIWQQYEKHQRLANAVYELAKVAVGEDKANEILEQNEIKLLN